MTKPLVSVLIAYYNHAKYVKKTLDSVLTQTYPNVEIIIVNDGSPDNAEFQKVIQEYLPDPRVTLINQTNQGIVAARNVAMTRAKGEYFNLLDSDDWLHPEKIERQVDFLESNRDYGLIYSDYYNVYEETNEVLPILATRHILELEPELFTAMWVGNVIGGPHTAMFRREWFEKAGFLLSGTDGCDDYEYWLRLAAMGCRMYYLPELLAYRREHVYNTSKDKNLMNQGRLKARAAIAEKFPEHVSCGMQNFIDQLGKMLEERNRWNEQLVNDNQRLLKDIYALRQWMFKLEGDVSSYQEAFSEVEYTNSVVRHVLDLQGELNRHIEEIQRKNDHILYLESYIQKLEQNQQQMANSKLMRLANLFSSGFNRVKGTTRS
ncbi:MAG TPA: glycosyltransferase [Chloroflexia bacterium]|nr:glycosyltransferase [Chloroflexia bacterium]